MWVEVSKANPLALRMAGRHYSRQKAYHELGPPGQKIVLLSADEKAVWGSHRPAPWTGIKRMDGFDGHSCFIFRNEGSLFLASDLIREAVEYTYSKWGRADFITYVAVDLVHSSNPGYCYLVAGWKPDGYTQSQKLGRLRRLVLRVSS